MKRDVVAGPPTGGLRLNGSWDDNGRSETPLMNLVAELRRNRNLTTMTPCEAAAKIPTTFLDAFPNLEQWQSCLKWHEVRCSTSAEAMVAYCIDGRTEPFIPAEPSDTNFSSIFVKVLEMIREGFTPMQIAEFLGSQLDDPLLSPSQKELIREAMHEWAGKQAKA